MPRIHVRCLAAYNSGILHGDWIDVEAGDTAEELQERIAAILRSSPCPNIQKRDHECLECHHKWSAPVTLSEHTPNLSGERAEQCPECESRSVMSSPTYPSSEEWAIHDHDGWEGLPVGEYTDLETLCEWAEALDECGPAYGVYVAHVGERYASLDDFRDSFRGEYASTADYAEDYVEQTGELHLVPEWLQPHIDYASIAHDWECGGDIWTADAPGGVYVFSAN